MDEVLTPDSSRFWPADRVPGRHLAAEFRQAVRARLPGDGRGLEQAGAGAEVAAARWSTPPPRATARPTRRSRVACYAVSPVPLSHAIASDQDPPSRTDRMLARTDRSDPHSRRRRRAAGRRGHGQRQRLGSDAARGRRCSSSSTSPFEARVVSAHRMPDEMFDYAEQARGRGLRAIIAGAGGAAHLPGMLAAKTTVPVLGVPVPTRYLHGQDSLLSIVQMPRGIPVATFAIGEAGAANAALFAVAMLAAGDPALAAALDEFRAQQTQRGRAMTCAAAGADDRRSIAAQLAKARPPRRVAAAGQLARRAGRRPARPHVLHGGAEPRLPGLRARSGRQQPGRAGRRSPSARRLPRSQRRWRRWQSLLPARRRPSSRTCRRRRLAALAARTARRRRRRRRGDRPGPDRREALHRPRAGVRGRAAPCGPARSPRLDAPSTRSLLPGILKVARLGLRRQGPGRASQSADEVRRGVRSACGAVAVRARARLATG